MRCPVCRAEVEQGPNCRRCRADLAMLFTLEEQRARALAAAYWYAAQGLVKSRRQSVRHAWMLLSVVANLGMLGYFKYGQFLLDNFTALMSAIGIAYHPAHYDIVLPVGISFYTFATMSYTLDVYLRRALPAQNLLDYALFVTFFPHLVAGPIMRPTELVPQFAQQRRASAQQNGRRLRVRRTFRPGTWGSPLPHTGRGSQAGRRGEAAQMRAGTPGEKRSGAIQTAATGYRAAANVESPPALVNYAYHVR